MQSPFDSSDAHEHPRSPGRSALSGRFWLLLAAFVLGGLAVALAVWTPYNRMHKVVAEIEARGGRVYMEPHGPGWLRELLRSAGAGVLRRPVAADLTDAEPDDELLREAAALSTLKRLDLYGPGVTDEGLRLLQELPELRLLALINCPNVSRGFLDELQRSRPRLRILRRGPAFLGIAGRPDPGGCRVISVQPESGAAQAGLRTGDVITAFAGRVVADFEALAELIAGRNPGDEVEIELERAGRRLTLTAVLGRWN